MSFIRLSEVEEGMKRFLSITTLFWILPITVLIAGLTVYSFLKSIWYTLYDELDKQITTSENIPLLLCAIVASFVLLFLIDKRVLHRLPGQIIEVFPLLFCALVSLYLIFAVRGLATNDALFLDGIINAFMSGDYHELTETGSYLFVYPFQLGYVLYGQIMHLLFGPSNYIAYQLVNLMSVLLTFFLLTRITQELFEQERTTKTAALLECGMLFLIVHTTFIYGDIPSLAPQAGALYLTICFLKKRRMWQGVAAALCIGLSSILKTNTYVAIVAMVIILAMDLLRCMEEKEMKRIRQGIVVCILVLLFGFGVPKAVAGGYAYFTGVPVSEMPKGVPSSAYFAMAIQDNGEGQPGWYNGYNRGIYADNQYNWEITDTVARRRFHDDLQDLMQNPKHMLYFFAKKFLTQWGDASCISMRELELTSRHVDGHSALIQSIIYGKGRIVFYWIMNVYQALCYFGSTIYCLGTVKKCFRKADCLLELTETLYLPQAFILLYVFGGMLFHEIWEGSSRYTMRYYVFLLPFAASGICSFLNYVGCRLIKRSVRSVLL